jgi:dipeptidyl aminopeptidase/acylaminoacyl peptidase
MSDDRSIERNARAWLELGPTQAPDHAVEAALRTIDTTSQERDLRIPWRKFRMTTPLRLGAAAVIGVLAVSAALLLRPSKSDVGTPSPLPTSPTSTPTTPPASPVPQVGDLPGWILLEHFGNKLDGSVTDGDTQDRTFWLVKADGSQLHEFPRGNPTVWKISPDWSPDGTRIAYSSVNPEVQLWLSDFQGTNPQLLSDPGCDPAKGCGQADPAFSPDGTQLVFVRLTGVGPDGTRGPITGSEIAIRDLASGNVTEFGSTNLASATTWAEQPSFSPDGSQIVFHRISMDAASVDGRPTASSLFIVNRDGTGLHEVAIPGKSPVGDASWSPDGTRILVTIQSIHDWNDAWRQGGGDDTPSIFSISPDGTGFTRLSSGGSATWIEGGQKILYFDQARIRVMDADASHSVPLALGPSMVNAPTGYTYYAFWQPQP